MVFESDDSSVEIIAVVKPVKDEDDDDENEYEDSICLGSSEYRIVGLQHYDGKAHPGEYVTLIREPHNPYDRNAIRVDNLQGEKVGHIKRQSAELLSRIMDNPSYKIRIDASILDNGCAYWSPVQLEFYCVHHPDNSQKEIILSQAESFLSSTLKRDKNFRLFTAQKQSRGTKSSMGDISRNMLDWESQSNELDKMFDQLCEDQLKSLPSIDIPSHYFKKDVKLMDHQKQGIQWLVQQETSQHKSNPFFQKTKEKGKDGWLCNITNCFQTNDPKPLKGGILCDEMGMGKTIQAIGLILSAPPKCSMLPSCTDKKENIHLIEGEKKKTSLYSKLLQNTAPKCPPKSHQHECCTLIVCPVSVMSNWQLQFEKFVNKDILNIELFHGPGRNKLVPSLEIGTVDVLIVSYNTLGVEYNHFKCGNIGENLKKKRKYSSIFDIQFHRIILDEAHQIRSNKSKHNKAVMEIKAERRIALTGTPFINQAEDISSLLSFVSLDPLADKDIFRRSIAQPINSGIDIDMGFTRLRLALASVALRRNKVSQHIQLTKKTVELRLIKYPMDENVHKEVYDAFFGTIQIAVNAMLSPTDSRKSNNQYTTIFEKILRLRQCCCSAALIDLEHRKVAVDIWKELKCRKKDQISVEEATGLLEKLQGAFEETKQLPECSICLEEFEEDSCKILRNCSHIFCSTCLKRFMDTTLNVQLHATRPKYKCPLCRSSFEESDIANKSDVTKAIARSKSSTFNTTRVDADTDNKTLKQIESPKILALLHSIKSEMKCEEKGVIFSQFTSFLDLIGLALTQKNETYIRLDGSMLPGKRKEAVSSFQNENGGPRFILCSLHAAGTGINLTRGNFVFMMDSWWNEAVENQAMDRVHRIGQTRSVHVIRFVMKETIEERMIELQRIKSLQAKGSMQRLSPEEKRAVRMDKLKSLLCINSASMIPLVK